MRTLEGTLTPPAGRFALVAGRFNQLVVDRLVAGAADGLRRHGVADDAIDLVYVPGSLNVTCVVPESPSLTGVASVIES